MAQVTIRTYTRNRGKDLSSLLAEFENTVPLLEDLAADLVDELIAEITPHNKTGVLAEGLTKTALYQKRGRAGDYWAIGIGDPQILTDWKQQAPRGTIAEFIRWLREYQKGFPDRRRRKTRGDLPNRSGRIRKPTKKQLRAQKAQAELTKALKKLEREAKRLAHESEEIAEKAYYELEALREFLARRGVTYRTQRRVVRRTISEQMFKTKKPIRDIQFVGSVIGQLYTLERHLDTGRRSKYSEQILTNISIKELFNSFKARTKLEEIYRKSRIPKK